VGRGRGWRRGRGRGRGDVGGSRGARVAVRVGVELRVEGVNVRNTLNCGLASGDLSDAEFDPISGTVGGPRTMQVGLRLSF